MSLQTENTVKEFIQTICEQIRCKKIHSTISQEIETHIAEQKEAFLEKGLSEEDATKKTIESMGSAVLVGQQLDRVHRPKTEWSVLLSAAILFITGILLRIIVYSDSYSILELILSSFIGLFLFALIYYIDYSILGTNIKLIYVSMVLFGIISISYLPAFVMGANMWINGSSVLGYYVSLLFVPIYGAVIYQFKNRGYWGIILCGILYLPFFFISLFTCGVTAVIIITLACLITLTIVILTGWFGRPKLPSFALVYIPVSLAAILFYFFIFPDYRVDRFITIFHPEQNPASYGYQGMQLRYLLSNSQLFGQALSSPNIRMPLSSLMDTHMITYLIVKYGYFIAILIIGLFAVFFYRSIKAILKLKSKLGFFTALSCFLTLTFQFILYLLPNLGIWFFNPKILPFISNGKLGLWTNMILLGLLLSTFRNDSIFVEKNTFSYFSPFFQYEDGKLIIDFKPNRTLK